MKKYLVLGMFLLGISVVTATDNNIQMLKANLKNRMYATMVEMQAAKKNRTPDQFFVNLSDRLEADALLEMAADGYQVYDKSFKSYKNVSIEPVEETIIIMPRIDLLEKGLEIVAKKSDVVYVFIMEGDKLMENELYGDRSYETYMNSEISKKLPNNVLVYKLENDSVTDSGNRNNFEITNNIYNSRVFKNQIRKLYDETSRYKVFNYLNTESY